MPPLPHLRAGALWLPFALAHVLAGVVGLSTAGALVVLGAGAELSRAPHVANAAGLGAALLHAGGVALAIAGAHGNYMASARS